MYEAMTLRRDEKPATGETSIPFGLDNSSCSIPLKARTGGFSKEAIPAAKDMTSF